MWDFGKSTMLVLDTNSKLEPNLYDVEFVSIFTEL